MSDSPGSLERTGTAVTNFELSLPKAQSDLARESLKDPYRLDFLGLGREAREREIGASCSARAKTRLWPNTRLATRASR
jgi:predicted nuclease of restriction endonuclease-like (RecB) superfamily